MVFTQWAKVDILRKLYKMDQSKFSPFSPPFFSLLFIGKRQKEKPKHLKFAITNFDNPVLNKVKRPFGKNNLHKWNTKI